MPDNTPRFPLYQTSTLLLEALRERLFGFVAATSHYLRFKLLADPAHALLATQPTFFSFEGEYSVIADPAGGEVGSRIQTVQAEVAKYLGIVFACVLSLSIVLQPLLTGLTGLYRLTGFQVEPDGTIVGQYGCVHEVLVPLPVHAPPKTSSTAALPAPATGAVLTPAPSVTTSPTPSSLPTDVSTASPSDISPQSATSPASTPKTEQDLVPVYAPQTSVKQEPGTPALKNTPKEEAMAMDGDGGFEVIAMRMAGELRVSVLWDRSHKYFPGLRTVVQFQLVG
jgi:hypothetical protein